MSSKLFIGNLSFKVSDADLSELFSQLNIPLESSTIMRDVDSGRSRGFAFAQLVAEADMARAIKELHGKVLDGRALTVNEARPQVKREFRGGGGAGGGRSHSKFGGRGDSRDRDRDRPKRSPKPALY